MLTSSAGPGIAPGFQFEAVAKSPSTPFFQEMSIVYSSRLPDTKAALALSCGIIISDAKALLKLCDGIRKIVAACFQHTCMHRISSLKAIRYSGEFLLSGDRIVKDLDNSIK